MITASFAAMMMAEQGATVTKVEPTDMGDPMRYIGTAKGGISALFANCNRGKRSVGINLKDAEGQALIRQMAVDADVVIHNFRPGVMDKLNLGSEQLRKDNPGLVYCAISGFGKHGPLGDAPAYDPVIQAHAGLTASQGTDSPVFIRNLICDKITAYTAIQAVTAALFVRERTSEGQHIDLSMLDSGLFFIFPDGYMNHTLLDDDVMQQPLLADLIYQLTSTKDGAITLSAGTDQQRASVLTALGREDMLSDPRFNSLEKLLVHMDEYREELADEFLKFATDDILERLKQHSVPAAKCHEYEEVLSQAQIVANETVQIREHPVMGKMRIIRSPARFSGERLPAGAHSPGHGEHTDTVLTDMGIDAEQLAAYRAAGVIL